MKIGMMTTWNTHCGAAIHAEMVGKVWMERGNSLTIFAPITAKKLRKRDEPWVVRNYELKKTESEKGLRFDPKPFLTTDYDIFVHQNVGPMPLHRLFPVFKKIKKKAKTVLITHLGRIPDDLYFLKFEWDAVVCFDNRWLKILKGIFPEDKIHIIHYPCHPVLIGNKLKARRVLKFDEKKRMIFIYGISAHQYLHLIPTIERINRRYPLIFVVVTGIKDWLDLFKALKGRYNFIRVKEEIMSIKRLYHYLHAADLMLFHRDPSKDIVVSSSIMLCLGSGCPIAAYNSNFVETFKDEIIKYHNLKQLEEKIEIVFENGPVLENTLRMAKTYVDRNSSYRIADQFLRLFNQLTFN